MGIIRLGESYGHDRLEAAAARGLAIGSLSYRSIGDVASPESILKNGLDRQPLPEVEPAPPATHDNIRGAAYYASQTNNASC
jgi:hypothetical protein